MNTIFIYCVYFLNENLYKTYNENAKIIFVNDLVELFVYITRTPRNMRGVHNVIWQLNF